MGLAGLLLLKFFLDKSTISSNACIFEGANYSKTKKKTISGTIQKKQSLHIGIDQKDPETDQYE